MPLICDNNVTVPVSLDGDEVVHPGDIVEIFEDTFGVVIGPSDVTFRGREFFTVQPLTGRTL